MNNPKVTEALQTLADGITAYTKSDAWQTYLAAAHRFHHYSPSNVMLILMQNPHATRIAGYETWRSMGRQVRKGEHGIVILAPAGAPAITTVGDDGIETTTAGPCHHFRAASVFDISQTDGEPLPPLPIDDPRAEDPADLYGRLVALATAKGHPVTETPTLTGDTHGYIDTTTGAIVILASLSPAQKARTMAHELAHAILHVEPANDTTEHAIREIEAESAAYIVAHVHGLQAGGYTFPYFSTWAASTKNSQATFGRIATRARDCAATILDAVAA